MASPTRPQWSPLLGRPGRDIEIVAAVARTVFLLIVISTPAFREAQGARGSLLVAVVIAAAAYNVVVFVCHAAGVYVPRPLIVLVDILLVSLWCYFADGDCYVFFALYYPIIIVAGLWFSVWGAPITALLCSALYWWATHAPRPTSQGFELNGRWVAWQTGLLLVTSGVVAAIARFRERERQELAASTAQVGRLRRQFEAARYVDQLLRPQRLPEAPGLDVAHQYQLAAIRFSPYYGDYYDLIPLGGRRWGLCIADLSGHYARPIGYMPAVKSALRLTAQREPSPARVLRELNREVAASIGDQSDLESFVSMCYLVVDLDQGTLTYARAGHEPPLFLPATGEPFSLDRAGILLGVLPDADYEEESLPLHTGDTIVLFTDGVTEAVDARDRPLGREGLLAALQAARGAATAREMVWAVLGAVRDYAKGGRRRDDMTLLIARVTATDLGRPQRD